MSAVDYERALVLALRSDDVDTADDAAARLKAMGWTAAKIRKARRL